MNYKIYFVFIALLVLSCTRDTTRNKIVFNDSAEAVQDSLILMIKLLDKLPKEQMVNYFIDDDGYLFINNSKKILYTHAPTDLVLRKDFVFSKFSESEIVSFFHLIDYLNKNHISDVHFEGSIGQFLFTYRENKKEVTVDNLRDILIVSDEFLLDNKFQKYYQVLDKKNLIKLIALKEATI